MITNVYMSTCDGYYRQKDGLAMGSPPAQCLANIWLFKREPEIKDNAKLFERYMDDIIRSIFENRFKAKVEQVNSLHDNLQFTVERERERDRFQIGVY